MQTMSIRNWFTEPSHWRDERVMRLRGIVTIVLVGIALFTAVCFYGNYAVEVHSCAENAKQMELEYDYGLWTGCKVDVPGVGWRDIDKIRVNYTPED